MAFDPSIISSIPDYAGNPVKAKQNALTLQDMMDRGQLNKLQLGAAQKEASESAGVEKILKDSDYSTPEGLSATAAKVNKVSPRAAMDLLKTGQSYQSGQVKQQTDQLELMDKRLEIMGGVLTPIVLKAQEMKNSGASELDVNAYISQQMPQALQQLRSMTLSDGKPALPDNILQMVTSAPRDLPTLQSWGAWSEKQRGALKQQLDQFKADTQLKAQTTRDNHELETERHNRAGEATAARRTAVAESKAAGFDDVQSELLAAFADRSISLPAGLRSQQQIKSTIDGLLKKHPNMSPDQIADGIKAGKLQLAAETKGAQVAGNQIGKVALATNEINTFGDQTLQAAAAIPRGKFVPWNKLKNYADSKISDPALLRLKGKLQALENAYNQLAGRSGTDVAKREHIHQLFDDANSTEAIQTLVQVLKEEAQGGKEAADRTIAETSTSSIPGTSSPGGASSTQGLSPSGAGGASPGGPALTPGNSYKHASGATIEILPEGQ